MDNTQNTKKTQGSQKCVATEILICCWWEYKRVQPLWRTVCQFVSKLKVLLLCYQQSKNKPKGVRKNHVHTKTFM
jgi:hypothetical protein